MAGRGRCRPRPFGVADGPQREWVAEPESAACGRPRIRRRRVWKEERRMFNIHRKEIVWGGRKLVLETGRFARQADGAVMATYGETTVLCTAVAQKAPKPGVDFFPLTVNYQEKTFAAGKIPGGFFKREGRPS